MASPTRRRAAEKSRQLNDTFRPKFPIDPFAAASVREPWFLRPEALPSVPAQARRDVILVLGAPSLADLNALLSSKHLANSLLIVATHSPPEIPHTALPTIRILRLQSPLSIEQAGAVRFVNVLEWAERVARLWRKYGGYGVAELSEDDDGVEHLTPPALMRFRSSYSTPSSPRSSSTQLSPDPRASTSTLDPWGQPGRPRSLSSKILGRARQLSLPAVDPTQRLFDGLFNFLPQDVPDKALLKQAILVTTISKPFLISSATRPPLRGKRDSMQSSKSSTSIYLPPTPPFQSRESLPSVPLLPTKAHLVHVLPVESRSFNSFARSKLVQSLESFLLSFGFPTSMDVHSSTDDLADRLRPYIMTSTCLGETITTGASAATTSPYGAWASDCTLAELVLCGSLDGEDSPSSPQSPHARALTRATPRALLSQASDVVLLGDDVPLPPAVVVSPSEPIHGRLTRESTASSMSSTSSASPTFGTLRSLSPSSPLARSETYASFGGLPTPPDSEESVVDDTAYSPPAPPPAALPPPPAVPAPTARKSRWRFWNRSKAHAR